MAETTEIPDGKVRTALQAAQLYANDASCVGKVIVVTGAYSGIGRETTKALLKVGASKLILGGRNAKLQQEFVRQLVDQEGFEESRIDGEQLLDLADLDSVQAFASFVSKKYKNIDVLILNAGVMNTPLMETKQGLEMQFGTNVVGHFLLAKVLAPITSRQVWVSSEAHKRFDGPPFDLKGYQDKKYNRAEHYNGWLQYQQSKLANIMLAKEFAKRYQPMQAVSLHPGVIKTNLSRYMSWFDLLSAIFSLLRRGMTSFKSVEQGAATTVTCALKPEVQNGAYYMDCEVGKEIPNAKLDDDNAALFEFCDELTKDYQRLS